MGCGKLVGFGKHWGRGTIDWQGLLSLNMDKEENLVWQNFKSVTLLKNVVKITNLDDYLLFTFLTTFQNTSLKVMENSTLRKY
jgi:hypothetical protein